MRSQFCPKCEFLSMMVFWLEKWLLILIGLKSGYRGIKNKAVGDGTDWDANTAVAME